MKRRFGQLLVLIGLILLIIFFFSDAGRPPHPLIFILGLAGVIIGMLLLWQSRTPPVPSGRFRTARKIFEKKK